MRSVFKPIFTAIFALVLLCTNAICQDQLHQKSSKYDKLPVELKPSDPEIRALMKSASEYSEQGEGEQAISKIEKALSLSNEKGLTHDKAIAEAALAGNRFFQGNWPDAETLWSKALQ